MRSTVLTVSLILATAALAGGDSPKDRQMAGCPPCPEPKVITRTVKADCPPAPKLECPDCVCDPCPKCEPTVKYVDRWYESPPSYVHEPEPGRWLFAASALYQEDPGLGAGLGYRWSNGVTLVGQALYLDREGCDGFEDEVMYRYMPVEYYCPGCDHDKWGFGATVLIPLGRK